jgi:hypothetical protein
MRLVYVCSVLLLVSLNAPAQPQYVDYTVDPNTVQCLP